MFVASAFLIRPYWSQSTRSWFRSNSPVPVSSPEIYERIHRRQLRCGLQLHLLSVNFCLQNCPLLCKSFITQQQSSISERRETSVTGEATGVPRQWQRPLAQMNLSVCNKTLQQT